MNYLKKDEHEGQIVSDDPLSTNICSDILPALNQSEDLQAVFLSIADRKTTMSCSEVDIIKDFEMQKKRYLQWKESNSPPTNISLSLLNEEGVNQFITHTIPFVDRFRLRSIHENRPLRFWHCNSANEREFVLFEYVVERCNFKGVVQDLTTQFAIGLNIKRETTNEYTVVVTTGFSENVRNSVQRQLRVDFESFHGFEMALSATATSFFRKLRLVSAFISKIRASLSLVWTGRSGVILLNGVGVAALMIILLPLFSGWINGGEEVETMPEPPNFHSGIENETYATREVRTFGDLKQQIEHSTGIVASNQSPSPDAKKKQTKKPEPLVILDECENAAMPPIGSVPAVNENSYPSNNALIGNNNNYQPEEPEKECNAQEGN